MCVCVSSPFRIKHSLYCNRWLHLNFFCVCSQLFCFYVGSKWITSNFNARSKFAQFTCSTKHVPLWLFAIINDMKTSNLLNCNTFVLRFTHWHKPFLYFFLFQFWLQQKLLSFIFICGVKWFWQTISNDMNWVILFSYFFFDVVRFEFTENIIVNKIYLDALFFIFLHSTKTNKDRDGERQRKHFYRYKPSIYCL